MRQQLQIITKVFITAVFVINLMVIMPSGLFSQPVMKIDNYSGCSSSELLIPVEIENFDDISAFTIYIGVSSSEVELIGFEDVNEAFSSGSFVGGENIQNGYITFNWASLSGVSVESGVLCNIRVQLLGISEEFKFLETCEIVHSDLTIIEDVNYQDGSVVAISSIIPDPVSQLIVENSPATIELSGLTDDVTVQWQKNADTEWVDINDIPPYSGTNTSVLVIEAVVASMNNSYYRGLLSNGNCSEGSESSELLVSTSGIGNHNDQVKDAIMQIYPNPVSSILNCVFNSDINNTELILVSLDGKMLVKNKIGNVVNGQLFSIELDNISSGQYYLRMFSNGRLLSNLTVIIQ